MVTTICILIIAAMILSFIYDDGTGLEALDNTSIQAKPPIVKLGKLTSISRIKQIEFQLAACRRVLARFNTDKTTAKADKSKLFGQMNRLRAEKARLIKLA